MPARPERTACVFSSLDDVLRQGLQTRHLVAKLSRFEEDLRMLSRRELSIALACMSFS